MATPDDLLIFSPQFFGINAICIQISDNLFTFSLCSQCDAIQWRSCKAGWKEAIKNQQQCRQRESDRDRRLLLSAGLLLNGTI